MNKTKFFVKCFSLLCVSLFFSCNSKKQNDGLTIETGILSIGTEYGYPPFEYLADDGVTLIGLDVDLWNELCMRLKLKPVYHDTQWAGIFAGLESNRYDCIISAVTITPERKEKFLVTEPYVQNSDCIIVRKLFNSKIERPENLSGLKVAYQAETVSDVYAQKLLSSGINFSVYEYDKLMDAFDDLRFERVDAVIAESVASENLVKKNPGIYRIDYTSEPDEFFGILVNKNNPELFNKIQNILFEMENDGTMDMLRDKWK